MTDSDQRWGDPQSGVANSHAAGPTSPSSQRTLFRVILVVVAAVVLSYSVNPSCRRSGPNGDSHSAVGRRLSDVEFRSLANPDHWVNNEELRGRVVLINFWGTWCPPCRAEMPDLNALNEKYRDNEDFRLLAVSVPAPGDDDISSLRDTTEAYLAENGYSLPTYADPQSAAQMALAMIAGADPSRLGVPTTCVLDRQGVIRGVWMGGSPTAVAEMSELVGRLLVEETQKSS